MTALETIALTAATGAAAALWVTLLRHRRAHRRLHAELAATRSRFDRELAAARAERDTLLNAIGDAFLLIDPAARITFANRAAHQLCAANTLAGRPLREVFTDPRVTRALDQSLSATDAVQTRITLSPQTSLSGDRDATAWLVDACKVPSADGSPPHTRVIIRDITAEFQTEQIRKDFVANASHELRTPMAIINGYLENLLDNDMLEDPPLARHFLGVMRKHASRISEIVEDMLLISRLESTEENQLTLEPFSLRECAQDILERLDSMIQNQQAKVRLTLPEPPADTLVGDRFYWFQALFNLTENALKQNPRPGLELEIGATRHTDHLEIWVADNGIGIPSADLPFIFRRFYRVEKHHSQHEIKGTGLGLSIVKRAIEAHGGTITASSTPGVETKFRITLPNPPPPPPPP